MKHPNLGVHQTGSSSLFGGADPSIGPDVLSALRPIAARTPGFALHVFESAGHGFLTDLDAADPSRRDTAEAALAVCGKALGLDAGRRG